MGIIFTIKEPNMKLQKNVSLLTVLGAVVALTAVTAASEDAEKLFDTKCAVCHSKTRPADPSTVNAPALMGVMRHIKMRYPDKASAVTFMVDYVLNPSKEKAICKPQKIERFGLMPSQKGAVSKEELIEVSEWMYDNYPPANFQGRGMGRGGKRSTFQGTSK
jgi:cytochrome c